MISFVTTSPIYECVQSRQRTISTLEVRYLRTPRRVFKFALRMTSIAVAQTGSSTAANTSDLPAYGDTPALLLTNDDGLDPGNAMVLDVARTMVRRGHRVVVCAPGQNNSACGQKITLGVKMTFRRHLDLEAEYGDGGDLLSVFSLEEGSPSDCIIIAIEPRTGLLAKLGLRPLMTLSGVNLGPNLGSDVLYSGTFGAARQSAMYAIPALAVSLGAFGKRREDPAYAKSCDASVEAAASIAVQLLALLPATLPDAGRQRPVRLQSPAMNGTRGGAIDALRSAFAVGDVLVNVNVPKDWTGDYEACYLDSVFYRSVVEWGDVTSPPTGHEAGSVRIGTAGSVDHMFANASDALALKRGRASVSTVSTWPVSHPLAIPDILVRAAVPQPVTAGIVGLPAWMIE
jgi:5'/3'-nucleotidase SurE